MDWNYQKASAPPWSSSDPTPPIPGLDCSSKECHRIFRQLHQAQQKALDSGSGASIRAVFYTSGWSARLAVREATVAGAGCVTAVAQPPHAPPFIRPATVYLDSVTSHRRITFRAYLGVANAPQLPAILSRPATMTGGIGKLQKWAHNATGRCNKCCWFVVDRRSWSWM